MFGGASLILFKTLQWSCSSWVIGTTEEVFLHSRTRPGSGGVPRSRIVTAAVVYTCLGSNGILSEAHRDHTDLSTFEVTRDHLNKRILLDGVLQYKKEDTRKGTDLSIKIVIEQF